MKIISSYLSPVEQQVITMRFSGIDIKQIGNSLGKSTRTTKKIETRAWNKLRRSYATISQWEKLVKSGESMKAISQSPIKHSLADVMS